jgi:hypothetical protein
VSGHLEEIQAMPVITFYRQARQDGGIRTGIEIDRDVIFGRYEPGPDEDKPLLTWYVDVDCQGESLPFRPDVVRQWLLDNSAPIRRGLEAIAEEIASGLDLHLGVQEREIPGAPGGVKVTVSYTAIRRFEAQRLAQVVRDFAEHWDDRIRNLPETLPVTL